MAILTFAIPSNLHATELSTICNKRAECTIQSYYNTITNHSNFYTQEIIVKSTIDTFINYGDMTVDGKQQVFWIAQNGYIGHFINYGSIGDVVSSPYKMSFWVDGGSIGKVTNYGFMGGIGYKNNHTLTLNNLGIIGITHESNNLSATYNAKIQIENYMVMIRESASSFNNFTGYNGNTSSHAKSSHIKIKVSDGGSVVFKDDDSRIILDFGDDFEFGKGYKIDKIATDTSGNPYKDLGVDFDRLMPRNDLYHITQSGDSFVVNLKPESSTIGNLYKSNIRTMNNFYTISNSMIYPHKFAKKRVVKRKRVRRIKRTAESLFQGDYVESWQSKLDSPSLAEGARGWVDTIESLESFAYKSDSNNLSDSIDSPESLASNESFSYKSDSNNLSDLSDSTTYTNQNNTNHIRIANIDETNQRMNRNRISTNRQAKSTISSTQSTQTIPSTLSTQNTNYHFILTPFLNHNLFLNQVDIISLD